MKNIFIALLLSAVCSGVMAAWVEAGTSNNQTTYADPLSIRKAGNTVKMWSLYDLKKSDSLGPGTKPFLSAKIQIEFNCNDETYKTTYISFHTGHMAAGEVVSTGNEYSQWTPIPPGAAIESLSKVACSK